MNYQLGVAMNVSNQRINLSHNNGESCNRVGHGRGRGRGRGLGHQKSVSIRYGDELENRLKVLYCLILCIDWQNLYHHESDSNNHLVNSHLDPLVLGEKLS